ncbi:MAG: biotin/lipoyl-binding protein [Acidobacteriota bacterium]|nr:biotin/lipoyl-binding protein [Acidobacteriota bacterium]
MNLEILVNGKRLVPDDSADVVEVEPGVYSVILQGRSYEARVNGAEVSVESRRLLVEVQDPRRWNPASATLPGEGRATLKAPMPGKVIRILAHPGDDVTAGQGILVIEAMKMQNELKAPRAGRIASVSVKENDAVTAGTILATIE